MAIKNIKLGSAELRILDNYKIITPFYIREKSYVGSRSTLLAGNSNSTGLLTLSITGLKRIDSADSGVIYWHVHVLQTTSQNRRSEVIVAASHLVCCQEVSCHLYMTHNLVLIRFHVMFSSPTCSLNYLNRYKIRLNGIWWSACRLLVALWISVVNCSPVRTFVNKVWWPFVLLPRY